MYPLKFTPILHDKIWGGHKLERMFGKTPVALPNIGESWELSGHPSDTSVVSNGKLSGKSLTELIEIYKEELVGKRVYQRFGNEFPLLFKLIDANDNLSIQVHPNDEDARKRHNSFGKTEMWVVLDADEDASLIIGFSEDCSKEDYLKALENGKVESLLQKVPVQKGDVFFIPAGLVHAIGKGVVVAEIQESSDITYRIFDYNRKDDNGNERELHTDLALDVINFKASKNPKTEYVPKLNDQVEIAKCEYFTTNLLELDKQAVKHNETAETFIVYMCLDGEVDVLGGTDTVNLKQGETLMIPAALKEFTLSPKNGKVKLLEVLID